MSCRPRGRRVPPAIAAALLALAAAACQAEPERLCDRVRVIWPFFEVEATDDVAPGQDGVQIDLALRTNLAPGTEAVISVIGADEIPVPHPDAAVADAEGVLAFEAITVPLGRVQLSLVAHDECGPVSSARRLYVWDGAGFPTCRLALGVDPAASDAHGGLGVIGVADDVDPATDGIQIPVEVDAGRPDMDVALFVRDVESATDAELREVSGEDRVLAADVTVPPGEVAIRAVCSWAPEDLHPSSHTERFFVEAGVE